MLKENEAGRILPDHRSAQNGEGGRLDYPVGAVPEFGQTIEVAPGILWLRMPLPMSLNAINLYLCDDGDGWTIVDTGLNTSMTRDHWDDVFRDILGERPVNRILVTHFHPDHVGLAGWLKERTGAPLWMSRGEFLMGRTLLLDIREEPPDEVIDFYRGAGFDDQVIEAFRKRGYGNYARAVWPLPIAYKRLRDGDNLVFGGREWRVVVGTGHCPEHVCLYSAEEELLISGDQLLPKITSNISVFPTEPDADPLGDWFASLRKLEDLPKGTFILPSHNEPFRRLHRRTKDIREAHVRRLVALHELCAEAPTCAVEAFPALFKRALSGPEFVMATGEAIAHMRFLEARGHVMRERDGAVDRFRATGVFDANSVRNEFA